MVALLQILRLWAAFIETDGTRDAACEQKCQLLRRINSVFDNRITRRPRRDYRLTAWHVEGVSGCGWHSASPSHCECVKCQTWRWPVTDPMHRHLRLTQQLTRCQSKQPIPVFSLEQLVQLPSIWTSKQANILYWRYIEFIILSALVKISLVAQIHSHLTDFSLTLHGHSDNDWIDLHVLNLSFLCMFCVVVIIIFASLGILPRKDYYYRHDYPCHHHRFNSYYLHY